MNNTTSIIEHSVVISRELSELLAGLVFVYFFTCCLCICCINWYRQKRILEKRISNDSQIVINKDVHKKVMELIPMQPQVEIVIERI